MLPNFPTRPVVKNVFHFEISVEKPELLKGDAILGEAQILRGLEWRLECVHKENPEKMDISLAMPQPLHGLYFMDCSYTVAVKRGDEMVLEHKQEKAETLSVLSTHLLRSVDNPTALFGDEDRILVTVDVHVFRSKRIDFSKPSEFSDVALKLDDDTVLHLSKPLLSIHSPFFHHLLLSHFKPKNVVELHHVDLDSLLVILYPSTAFRSASNVDLDVEGLLVESLELASRLRLDVALHGFETFIARLEKPTIFRFIRYADRLGMILLMHEILAAANKLELRLLYDQLDDSFSVQTLEEFVEHLLSMD
ncbi:hypothetical protein L596_018424 [Steinernema carpocapsae]|uniref:BTB domain-containing protein n=1 Tax=Steinernema carpocapsae TaxID=34508 RepID=A0A4U5N5E5_STECR|nr:hypothetical protein L596_018424 [Steinernema carpocapsae]